MSLTEVLDIISEHVFKCLFIFLPSGLTKYLGDRNNKIQPPPKKPLFAMVKNEQIRILCILILNMNKILSARFANIYFTSGLQVSLIFSVTCGNKDTCLRSQS